MNKSSLHNSGIKPEYLPVHEKLPHNKAIFPCGFHCCYHAQNRTTVCTHIHKEDLHVMLGCPYCEHHVWSTDPWAKPICTHHPGLPMFVEMKLECHLLGYYLCLYTLMYTLMYTLTSWSVLHLRNLRKFWQSLCEGAD